MIIKVIALALLGGFIWFAIVYPLKKIFKMDSEWAVKFSLILFVLTYSGVLSLIPVK